MEAALGLSLFLFMAVLMMVPFQIMDTHRKVQAVLESSGEAICQYAYAKELQELEAIREAVGDWGELAAKEYVEYQIRQNVDSKRVTGLSLGRSKILEDGLWVDLIAEYDIQFPFPVFMLDRLPQQVRCRRRAWVGEIGGVRSAKTTSEASDRQWVYMGKDGTRYHTSRTCHYLYNQTVSVTGKELETMKNQYGDAYTPCGICGSRGEGDSFLVMKGGEHYHTTPYCQSITAYVRQVELETVKHLGPCSYCSGG
ncbi:MAG: hypothetical protein ACLTKI_05450 [Lachnospiraceae bacterium]